MKKIILVLMVLLLSSNVFAQNNNDTHVTVDLQSLNSDTRNSVLSAIEKEKNKNIPTPPIVNPEKIQSWANIGKELGSAVSQMCKEINMGVNDFVKTPVGIITTCVLIWKLIGQNIINVVVGLVLLFIFEPIVIWSFIRLNINERVEIDDGKNGKSIKYIPRYEYSNDEGKYWSVALHIIIFVLIIIIAVIKM